MVENDIVNEFKKKGIDIYKIEKVTNSFSSNVYVVYSLKRKYIFKILYNNEKQKNEAMYIEYIINKIDVPKPLFSGTINNKSYNVISFIDGKSFSDSEAELLTDVQIFNIGVLLGKLHKIKPIDENYKSWTDYLYKCAERAHKNLGNILDKNDKIYNFIISTIDIIKGTYKNVVLHLDFRIGNIIFGNKEYLIDFESMRSGDPAFDFLKLKRILNKEKFNIFLEGYKSIKTMDEYFIFRLDFYNIFDAYTSVNWCYERNKLDSDFCDNSLNILKKEFL